MFDLDQFIAECTTAVRADPSFRSVREVVARSVSEPRSILKALGEPQRGELITLHQSDELTILNVVWAPRMTLLPHNHRMWAVIGIYTGREDNIFWRKVPGMPDGRIEAAGAKALGEKDVVPLGRDVIHSVTNPLGRLTGAIHVYGGDFFAPGRSEWDPESLAEGPCDVTRIAKRFEEANAILAQPPTPNA